MRIKNRKGAEKIMSVITFIIFFIVAAAVVYMVFSFYGKPYDVRNTEASLLTDDVAGCFVQGGYMADGWKSISSENFLGQCSLDFSVENANGWNNDQYYVEVSIYDFYSGQSLSNISAGNINLKTNCDIQSPNYPVCSKRDFYSVDKANNQYKIEILSIVRKTEKNVQ